MERIAGRVIDRGATSRCLTGDGGVQPPDSSPYRLFPSEVDPTLVVATRNHVCRMFLSNHASESPSLRQHCLCGQSLRLLPVVRTRSSVRRDAHAETATFDVRASEVAADQLTVGGDTFVVQGEPIRGDPDRLVWTFDVKLV